VRAALGAARGDLVALVVREGLLVSARGLGIGLAGAAALTRVMQRLLFGVTPLDTVSFIAAPGDAPSRRASRLSAAGIPCRAARPG